MNRTVKAIFGLALTLGVAARAPGQDIRFTPPSGGGAASAITAGDTDITGCTSQVIFADPSSKVNCDSGFTYDGTANTLTVPASTAAVLGSDLVTNGTFTGSATGWTLGGGGGAPDWAYATNNVTHGNGGGTSALQPSTPLSVSAASVYVVTVTVSGYSAGTLTVSIGGTNAPSIQSNGAFTFAITATNTANLLLTPTTTLVATIDTITVKQVTTTGVGAFVLTDPGSSAWNPNISAAGGGGNIWMGSQTARYAQSTAQNNIAAGLFTLRNIVTGTQNTVIGSQSGGGITSSSSNSFLGFASVPSLTIGNDNAGIGRSAGTGMFYGTGNLFLGSLSGFTTGPTGGDYNILIGYGAQLPSALSNIGVIGGNAASAGITDLYLGHGITKASPGDFHLRGTGGSGTDNAAGDFYYDGQISTGAATPGSHIFRVGAVLGTSATAQTLATLMTLRAATTSLPFVQFDGTLPSGAAGEVDGVKVNMAGAGSAAGVRGAFTSSLTAGYTGNYVTWGVGAANATVGTGAVADLYADGFDTAVFGQSTGASANSRVGVYGRAGSSSGANFGGAFGAASATNTPALNVGVDARAASGTNNIAVYAHLNNGSAFVNPAVSAALVADNQAFTTTPIALFRNAGTTLATFGPMSGGATTSNFFNLTGTLPTSLSAYAYGALINITTAGTSNAAPNGLGIFLNAGYTGVYPPSGIEVTTATAAPSTWASDVRKGNGNRGGWFGSTGSVATAGSGSFGVVGYTASATPYAVGAYGSCANTMNSGVCIGVMGNAVNAGTTPIRAGGYFSLITNTSILPTFVEAALVANNDTVAAPIFLAQDNGTSVVTIADGGVTTFASGIQTPYVVSANTGTATPSLANSLTVYTNTGDGDGSQVTLPNDPTVGTAFSVAVTVAQTLTVVPNTGESLYLGADQCAVSLTSNTIGSTLDVVAVVGGSGGKWFATSFSGTWSCND